MRVLIVEDDRMIGAALQASLRDASYAADWVTDGRSALAAAGAQHYDVMLLDLGLPGADGLQVLRSLRGQGNCVPVLVLTARDGLQDRVQGLDCGADDYVNKPFAMSELLARMRAILRRKDGIATPVLTSGALSLDPSTHEAMVAGRQPVKLSNREFALLRALMARPGAILSRSDLEDRVYGWGEEVDSNAIEYLIHAIRKKLGADAIRNVRGAGWIVPKGA